MVVVDEAHHLHWTEGDEGHFARLRLLDPDRFHDLNDFLNEEKGYQQLSDTVKMLLDNPDEPLKDEMLALLNTYLEDEAPENNNPEISEREEIVSKLLDRHGTGRVFLRNTARSD